MWIHGVWINCGTISLFRFEFVAITIITYKITKFLFKHWSFPSTADRRKHSFHPVKVNTSIWQESKTISRSGSFKCQFSYLFLFWKKCDFFWKMLNVSVNTIMHYNSDFSGINSFQQRLSFQSSDRVQYLQAQLFPVCTITAKGI